MVARAESLRALLRATRLTDRELSALLRDVARDADRTLLALEGDERVGARIRAAQIQLAREQVELWSNVESAIRRGALDAANRASDTAVLWERNLVRAAGLSTADWKASMRATARAGVDAYLARRHNGFTLSARVYRNRAWSQGLIERTINNGLLLGKSAREIADDVRGLINPRTPGGVSYAAMRLGRTELNNAFHEISRNKFAETPWTQGVRWNLSSSHPKSDVCDEYANDSHIRGGESGVFRSDEVPDKPHPQCFCFTTPVNVNQDEFLRAFRAGEYDQYVSSVTREASIAS